MWTGKSLVIDEIGEFRSLIELENLVKSRRKHLFGLIKGPFVQ